MPKNVALASKCFRFYIRCANSSAEVTFKTDLKNLEYQAKPAACRNFKAWNENKLAEMSG